MTEAGGPEANPTPYALPEPPPPPAVVGYPVVSADATGPAQPYAAVGSAKPHSSRRPLIAAGVVVLLVVVGLVVNGMLAKDPPSLPRFTEVRPTYGTIRMTITYSEQLGDGYSFISESNADAEVVHIAGSQSPDLLNGETTPTKFEYLVAADELWVYDFGQHTWMKAARPDADFYATASAPAVSLMFSDYIPESLRPYVSIEDVAEETVSGHKVKVYDLRLDLASYFNTGTDEYAPWAARMGIDKPAANSTMELAVDPDGVVWRMRSFSTMSLGQTQARDTDYEQVVTALLPGEFRPEYPTTYFDEATNQQVG